MGHFELYAFGSNGSAQLGVGHLEDSSLPLRVRIDDAGEIEHIASGGNHTLFLLKSGTALACGNNEKHQCGVPNVQHATDTIDVPVKLQIRDVETGTSPSISKIAATWTTSIFVSKTNQVYSIGEGLDGELGLGEGVHSAKEATLIPNFPPPGEKIAKIASSMAHTIIVLSSGVVYGWGKGRNGQLGEMATNIWSPQLINTPFAVYDAVCGKEFSCLVGHAGEMLLLGPNKRDRFNVRSAAPQSITLHKAQHSMIASWGSVYVLGPQGGDADAVQHKQVLAWGRDDHGQLPPSDLHAIQAIAAGSEHCLALTTDGRVRTWGWGEHGNCGVPVDASGDVKARSNDIPLAHRATQVFAGCATSFVITSVT